MKYILLEGIRENNLKNISLKVPKNKIIVFTGVSGSGKSSILFDTIAVESQRNLYELFPLYIRRKLPKYERPKSERIDHLSPVIVVDQKPIHNNTRSTVGTLTDINPLLRLLFSREGTPIVGTASEYSFNHPKGMCPVCSGIGKTVQLDLKKFFNINKSLNEGAILFSPFNIGTWQHHLYTRSNLFDPNKPLKDFTESEWNKFLYAKGVPENYKVFSSNENLSYDGIIDRFNRLWIHRDISSLKVSLQKEIEALLIDAACIACGGQRLNPKILSSKINGYSIGDYMDLEIIELIKVLETLDSTVAHTLSYQILNVLRRLEDIGLGYLSLGRESSSLSGGEGQRLKLICHLGSSLTGMMFILDEPSAGLHARDIYRLNKLLISLKEKGNSVLIVEHNRDVIAIADEIIDVGPFAGIQGGKIVYQGDYQGLLKSATVTGKALANKVAINLNPRKKRGSYPIHVKDWYCLKEINTEIPKGVLTVVSGVAGSGKSTFLKVIQQKYPDVIMIDQKLIGANIRSTPASYTGIMDILRKLFAKENQVELGLFSFNSVGACATCKGKGKIFPDMVFADPIAICCEDCNGQRYSKTALSYRYHNKNIAEVLDMTIDEALIFFAQTNIHKRLVCLQDVGLGYLTLGQPLSTLSAGEKKRIKIAGELSMSGNIYVMDEPTTGLHVTDIKGLLSLVDIIIANGNTVILAEHNLDVVASADWVIDLGPEAGVLGGEIIFEGTPSELLKLQNNHTATYLRACCKV